MSDQSPSLLVSDTQTHYKLDYLAKRIDKVSRSCRKLENLTFSVLGSALLVQEIPIPVPPVSAEALTDSSEDLQGWEALES